MFPALEYFCLVEKFIVSEKIDMHLEYGAANFNGSGDLRLYREKFPSKNAKSETFSYLHRQLLEGGSFHVKRLYASRSRHVRFREVH